jgi:hypothetical protein
MWRLVFGGCLFALSLFGPAAADQMGDRVPKYQHRNNAPNPLAEGVAAYQRGDYANAMRILRPLAADQGMALAQFSLGVMFANGMGTPQDYAQAAMWYRKAADQGDDKHRPVSAQCTLKAKGCRKTTRRPSTGIARPPIRGMPTQKPASGGCTPRAWGFHRTMRKPPTGPAKPPIAGMPTLRPT